MSRSKSWLTIQSEYYPLFGLFWLLKALPFEWSIALSYGIIRIVYLFLGKRQRIVDKNLQLCFPEMSEARRRIVIKKSLHNLAKDIAALPRMPTIATAGLKEWVTLEGEEYFEAARKQGKGVITFSAHYGCWDALAVCMPPWLDIPSGFVERPLDNPRLETLMMQMRVAGGAQAFPRRQILKQGLKLMRDQNLLGILIDQNLAHGGVFVDFFGRPAASTSIVSVLARRTGCIVLPVHSKWVGNKIKISIFPPVPPSTNPVAFTAIKEDTQAITTIIEGWIREDPAPWLWLHNRWKRQPESNN